jgi:NADPH:quinone reductase-like Zn-dependent oxidoreductase
VDIAIDCLGGSMLGECLPYVKYGCRWIVIAALAGAEATIDLKTIYKKNIRIIGSTLRSRTPEMKASILSALVSEVWPRVASGEVKPTIYKVLPITEAEQAHAILARGENVGKVVLSVE